MHALHRHGEIKNLTPCTIRELGTKQKTHQARTTKQHKNPSDHPESPAKNSLCPTVRESGKTKSYILCQFLHSVQVRVFWDSAGFGSLFFGRRLGIFSNWLVFSFSKSLSLEEKRRSHHHVRRSAQGN